jgi:hypothetical protein
MRGCTAARTAVLEQHADPLVTESQQIWDERVPVACIRLAQPWLEAIRHRGPDGHGWAEPGAADRAPDGW